MIKLVLVRHGESIWNKENKFTGWTDVELSQKGINEAIEAGKLLNKNGYTFDIAYTSLLSRSKQTLRYILENIKYGNIEVRKSYKLNERHYGALQGLNKDETVKKYGEEQVKLWRRSYSIRPPLLDKDDPRYPGNDPKYKDIDEEYLPLGESLEDTYKRVVEYFNSDIVVGLKTKTSAIVVAHGNSLRALMKYLDNISDEDIVNLEIKTGKPIIYEFTDDLKVIRHYYLEDKE